jgi:hypothetical protein
LRRAIEDLRRQLGEMDESQGGANGATRPRELENKA